MTPLKELDIQGSKPDGHGSFCWPKWQFYQTEFIMYYLEFIYYVMFSLKWIHNPLTPTVIQKLLQIICRVRLCPSYSFATALDSDINQTTGSGGHLSMWENRCMHAAVCLLRAGQPRSAGDAAKLGQFIGQFSWVASDPIGVKGLYSE